MGATTDPASVGPVDYLLVFVKNGTVVQHFKYPREFGDFQNLAARNVFSVEDDAFEVRLAATNTGPRRLNFHPKRSIATPGIVETNSVK